MKFEDERQLTARGKASSTRAEAWRAWEAAVLEFNRIFAQKREEKKKKTKFELAILRRFYDLVAVEKFPNRGTIKAVPLGDDYPVELGVIGTGCRPWWEFQITTDYPELREAQATLFRETGKLPNAFDLRLIKASAKGYSRQEVLDAVQKLQEATGLATNKIFVEGVAALVLSGVVENARPEDKEIEVSIFLKEGDVLHGDLPEGVKVTQVRKDWVGWCLNREFVRETDLQIRHPQKVLKEHEEVGKKGYMTAIRSWVYNKSY